MNKQQLQKTKHAATVGPSNCTFGYLSQRNKNLYSHKNQWVNG